MDRDGKKDTDMGFIRSLRVAELMFSDIIAHSEQFIPCIRCREGIGRPKRMNGIYKKTLLAKRNQHGGKKGIDRM
jgi:hypothetical protein